jgi:segregation and condensation protein B
MIELDASDDGDAAAADAARPSNVTPLFPDDTQHLRMLEALLFAAAEPLTAEGLGERLPQGVDVAALLEDLRGRYEKRGVNLVHVAGKWAFRTAPDLAFLLRREAVETRRLSRAAVETLAIIAYHQPVTRAEIEQVRGVTASKGTLDVLLEIGWIRPRGRRRVPGRPLTYGTTEAFLSHFGLASLTDLPGMEELKAAGFLDLSTFADISVPMPRDRQEGELDADEDPLDPEDLLEFEPEAGEGKPS